MSTIAEVQTDALDDKVNEVFAGRVVRKDLLHQIKKGTNVPSFVLEYLLARYCASDDPDEIEAGIQAVFETIDENYVRPDESNKAQSMVQQKGRHKLIDKVHVRYVESEKRHWAEMENFNSRRIAISERYYEDTERLLEGGIWAEVTLGHNDNEDDDYAFYIEDLRPIQLSRFNEERFFDGRQEFTRDEWLNVILRSVGLEPEQFDQRRKFHYLARLFSLVESNYNFIELGPRGTGKSYFFSEFTPYSTLVSGGQATKATLFYNKARSKVGLVGYWDTVAFDEVAGIKIKDQDAVQIMKDYMANGRFSRGVEVIANASMAFVGNIDYSIEQLVKSDEHDLFISLPDTFDLAVMDRLYCYLPGWEMPKTSSHHLTDHFGFITDYLGEAFHYLFRYSNRYDYVSKRVDFGGDVEGRDEKSINKTVCAFLKILHPSGDPTDEQFDEYVRYATEMRRRVKEQMNKRKGDDEFAKINLSYVTADGTEEVVYCPESREAVATQEPVRKGLDGEAIEESAVSAEPSIPEHEELTRTPEEDGEEAEPERKERHFTIYHGDTGHSYDSLFGTYLEGANEIVVEEPYVRLSHQIKNFIRFCETAVKRGPVEKIELVTGYDDEEQRLEVEEALTSLRDSLIERGVELEVNFSDTIHDREIRADNGWVIKIGRGLNFYQKPESWHALGVHDLDLRPCRETKVDIFQTEDSDSSNNS